MALEKELLEHLNNEQEPFSLKLQHATNFFKSSELPVQCKIILLKWILGETEGSHEIWTTLHNWFNSNHYKDITRYEIDNKAIKAIIEAIISKINSESDDTNISKPICETVIALLGNKLFEHYFKFNVEIYLKLIDNTLLRISCSDDLKKFLSLHLFYNSLLILDDFIEHFVNMFPTFVKCMVKFEDKNIFLQISKVVQKCIFYNNHRRFANHINRLFKNEQIEPCGLQILLNYLSKVFVSSKKSPELHFKLVFHAFATSYENDSLIIYKGFLILIKLIGFGYQQIPLNNCLIDDSIPTKKSHKILLELLTVLEETKLDLSCKVNEINLTEFLTIILTESIFPNKLSKINFQIIKKIILLDPVISQTLIEQILNYALLIDNASLTNEYEEFILIIFDLFSKLHRIENLISKIVMTFNNRLNDKTEKMKANNLKSENILTKNILQAFSNNIKSLASWQVINIFKTFLYALKKLIENEDGVDHDKLSYCLHVELLSELIGMFLSSVRVAEHTVAANVIEKTKKCLKELKEILHTFGKELLNRKHNCSLMRSFLNIAYHCAELSVILNYYSLNEEERPENPSNYNNSACNLTYLHPYLSAEEWCLISERITNFGELPCKQLLYKLFIQKVRALYIFEHKNNDELLSDLARYLTADLENNWKDILENNFLVNILIPTMNPISKHFLIDKFISNINDYGDCQKFSYIFTDNSILNATVYCTIVKCDKIMSKRKRKLDDDYVGIKKISSKICDMMTVDEFYNENMDFIANISKVYNESTKTVNSEPDLKINENKICELLEVLRMFPVIFCQEYIQKFFILYCFSLHKDLSLQFTKGNYKSLQQSIERLIMGMLQQCKYNLADIFKIESLCHEVLINFDEWKELFSLIIDNIFKNKDAIIDYESLVLSIAEQLLNPKYMECGIIIINAVNKLKKSKITKEVKNIGEKYRSIICNKICDLTSKTEPDDHLIPEYAYALKTVFAQNEEAQISKLLTVLDSYTNFALGRKEEFGKMGYLLLFNTVLQNKPKIKEFSEELPLKIWQLCKDNKEVFARSEEYQQLLLLIICFVSDEEFGSITNDLLFLSERAFQQRKYEDFGNFLKTWESIFTANINFVKSTNLQEMIEKLLSLILKHLEISKYDRNLYENIIKFEIILVQTHHFHLTPPMIDLLLLNVTVLIGKEDIDFQLFYKLLVSLLSNLLKYRKSLIMDRLPPYLQQYRTLLRNLCQISDSDTFKNEITVREIADCAYQLEKLTKNLVLHQKDMSRIAMYLIADILEQYEKITIYPNIKMHLNNCIYSLITICDQHAVSYLMRVLSNASTEIFKLMYENYKKYYRFTGKV